MQYGNKGIHATGSVLLVLLALMASLRARPAVADELSLLVNGKALHLGVAEGTKYNEKNWGLGAQYDWELKDSKWIPFATASGFIDSNKNTSYSAGGGALRRYGYWSVLR